MMATIWWLAACGLLINIGFSLVVMLRGRGVTDALLAVLLFGTAGVALVLVLSEALASSWGVDIALVLALLAAVFGVAAVRLGWFGVDDGRGSPR